MTNLRDLLNDFARELDDRDIEFEAYTREGSETRPYLVYKEQEKERLIEAYLEDIKERLIG